MNQEAKIPNFRELWQDFGTGLPTGPPVAVVGAAPTLPLVSGLF